MRRFYVFAFISIFSLPHNLIAEESTVGGATTRDLGIITATFDNQRSMPYNGALHIRAHQDKSDLIIRSFSAGKGTIKQSFDKLMVPTATDVKQIQISVSADKSKFVVPCLTSDNQEFIDLTEKKKIFLNVEISSAKTLTCKITSLAPLNETGFVAPVSKKRREA